MRKVFVAFSIVSILCLITGFVMGIASIWVGDYNLSNDLSDTALLVGMGGFMGVALFGVPLVLDGGW